MVLPDTTSIWHVKNQTFIYQLCIIGKNTGPLSRRIKVETIEREIVVGLAIQQHGFVFYLNADPNDHSASSDDTE